MFQVRRTPECGEESDGRQVHDGTPLSKGAPGRVSTGAGVVDWVVVRASASSRRASLGLNSLQRAGS